MFGPKLSIPSSINNLSGSNLSSFCKILRRLSLIGNIPIPARYSATSYEENREKNPTLTMFLSNGCYLKVI